MTKSGGLAMGLLLGCLGLNAQRFKITNTLDIARGDELVALQRADVEKAFPEAPQAAALGVKDQNGTFIPLQLDDLDGDASWDEAVFLCDIGPHSQTLFTLCDLKAKTLVYPRAHVRLRKKTGDRFGPALVNETMPVHNPPADFGKTPLPLYLTEGPAWENDKVAFRLYFDTRNGKDIFGKTTAKMMMDTVGTATSNNYHKISDWGMDILHAGSSLGAGALAFGVNTNGKDTIVRLGGRDVARQTFTRIADGPARAVFRMDYEWLFLGLPVKVSEEIRIWGGQYFYESRVNVTGAPPQTVLYAGIANFYDNKTAAFESGAKHVFYSSGNQSELRDGLTMAIAVPKKAFVESVTASKQTGSGFTHEIFDSHLVGQEIVDAKAEFRFYAYWQRTHAAQPDLEREARKYDNPLQIDWE